MQDRNRKSKFIRLVVIGASAGGIDALTQVLSSLPPDLPAAILIVQHLRSDRPTRLAEYLDRQSPLWVCLAESGVVLEPGVVYLAVPGLHLRVENGSLVLDTSEKVNYVRPSADVLFSSAAKIYGSRVIGVILSGTGHDGTNGCKEIKAKGGVTIAEDEITSLYFGMPSSAIDAGAIDYVLPVREIAGKIVEILGSR